MRLFSASCAAFLGLLALAAPTVHAADAGAAPAPAASAPVIRIAKIDLSAVQDDLLDVLFAKPEHAELKKSLDALDKADAERDRLTKEAAAAGKDPDEAVKNLPVLDDKPRQRLERLIHAELLRFLVKRYGSRFAVVLDTASNPDAIIYLDGEVVDVTQTVKQALQLNDF